MIFTLYWFLLYILGNLCIHRDKIQILQNKYARIIFNEDYHTPHRPLLLKLEWQSEDQCIKYHCKILLKHIYNRWYANELWNIGQYKNSL